MYPYGVLHAPASLCTYEPQFASDVYAMYQSVLYYEHAVPSDLLWKNCPEEEKGNFDYLVDVIDWDKNVDPDFHKNRFMAPKVITQSEDYTEEWICYKCKEVSAKRLTIEPGKTVTIKDAAAYGFILLQGKVNLAYGILKLQHLFVMENLQMMNSLLQKRPQKRVLSLQILLQPSRL